MSYDVISAEYCDDYKIKVTFENGKSGIVDFQAFVNGRGIFSRLRDKESFMRFHINTELGILEWENDIDIAPETLYAEATGEGLPEWMNK